MINLILWIIFGGLVGWFASLIMRSNYQQGVLGNIVLGIVGAIIGGEISKLIGGPTVSGFNFTSFIIALLGSIILITLARLFFRN